MVQAISNVSRPTTNRVSEASQQTANPVSATSPSPLKANGSRIPLTNKRSNRQQHGTQLKAVRDRIEELILLNERQWCEELVSGSKSKAARAFESEERDLIADVRQLVGVAGKRPQTQTGQSSSPNVAPKGKSSGSRNAASAIVKLRLSRPLVKILKAFAKTGRKPGQMIERALWDDASIQDAALLLRINPPRR